jgi:RHS repeat-associated protein
VTRHPNCQNTLLQTVGVRVGTTAQGSTGLTCPNSGSGTTGDLLNLAIQYGAAGADNGNVTSETIQNASGINVTQTFTPDAYNRLRTMTENTVTQTYGYDQFGNRAVTGGYVPSQNLTPQSVSGYATATNHWSAFQYDAMGNVTFDGINTSVYDGENRLYTSSQTISNATTTMQYSYDPEGRRVQVQQTGGSGPNTVYVHDAGGTLVAEYSNTPVVAPNTTQYLSVDHLGSTRLVMSAGPSVSRCYDYLPFGEEMMSGVDGRSGCYETGAQTTTQDFTSTKFTGKERDAETGLDWFEARYLSAAQGRFTSPDPATGSQRDPQSWNMYSYARNNPLLYTDPDGQTYRICDTGGHCDDSYSDANFDKNLAGTAKNGTIYDSNGNTIGTYQRTSFDDLGPLGNSLYQGMAARRQASNQIIGVFAGGSLLGGAGVAGGLAVSGAGLTTLGLQAAAVAAPLLPAVPSAIEKLQKIGLTLGQANAIVQSPATQKLIDNANNGNINCLQQVGDKVVRITTDPTGQRIISAGHVRANSIVNGLANGRFTAK